MAAKTPEKQATKQPPIPKGSSKVSAKTVTLSVIIVNYNVKEFLEQTLISVQKALKGISSEVIVVDNASSDGSVPALKPKFPQVKFLQNTENLGFAKASNQGLKMARGDYLALLNPDTVVQEDTFTRMLDFFEEFPDTGLLGCKILNPDGSLQLACRRSFPTPWVAFTKLSGLSVLFPGSKLFGKYNLTYLDPDTPCEVDALSGSFMMIRRQAFQDVGYLDESFFLYGEDLDWCCRVTQSGWKVRYTPATQIIHFKGESSKRAEFDNLKVFYRAMVLFAHKHFRQKYLFMPFWLLWVAIWLRAAASFFTKLLKVSVGAIVDFVLIVLGLFLSLYLRFGSFEHVQSFLPVFGIYTFVWLGSLKFFGCYSRYKYSLSKSWLGVLTGFLLNTSLTFFFNQYAFSRAVVLLGGVFCFLSIPGWRLLVRLLPANNLVPIAGRIGRTMLARRTLVVGDLESCKILIQKLNRQVDAGYEVCGIVETDGSGKAKTANGVPVLGKLNELKYLIKEHHIQEVIFATRQVPYDRILHIISQSEGENVNFKLIPSNFEVIIGKASIDHIEDVPLVDIDYKLHEPLYRFTKRAFDLGLSALLLVLGAPFFLLRRLTAGKKIQKRVVFGLKNLKISLYEIAAGRRWFIDKYLYLWPVFRGQMCFVGAEFCEVHNGTPPSWQSSLDLKPGLTGLVQVNAHKNLSEEDKKKYVLYYMKNYSVFLDLEILFKSLFKL